MRSLHPYESAVYSETAGALAKKIADLIANDTAEIADPDVRDPVIAIALAAAAQAIDGATYRRYGVTGCLRRLVDKWLQR